jgi:3-oxoisoapionate kinase
LKNLERKNNILLAFYGDDFTGSTDALEFICRAGAKAMLFIDPPTKEQLKNFPHLNAFGVAGKTRALSPQQIEQILMPAFKQIKSTGARHVHYKVCSTFDSSPTTGSIGKAIDCGAAVFNNAIIPVVGGAPALGRYCLFGNLFARMGIGSNGKIYRLDKHPSMSTHPVTPATESDLTAHLRKQTHKKIGLIDVLQLASPVNEWTIQKDDEVVMVDVLAETDLLKIGEWMDKQHNDKNALFSVGSSGVEMALGKYWNQTGLLDPVTSWPHPGKADSMLVISGSCSPVTTGQIEWAKANDFAELILKPDDLLTNGTVIHETVKQVTQILQKRKQVIIHTGYRQDYHVPSEKLGKALGTIAKETVHSNHIQRVVISGGDTSGYAAESMEIEAIEMIAPLITGAPLCRALSKHKSINGLEVNFKGGQVGSQNYFGVLFAGSL